MKYGGSVTELKQMKFEIIWIRQIACGEQATG
jgi:hypothetical protein